MYYDIDKMLEMINEKKSSVSVAVNEEYIISLCGYCTPSDKSINIKKVRVNCGIHEFDLSEIAKVKNSILLDLVNFLYGNQNVISVLEISTLRKNKKICEFFEISDWFFGLLMCADLIAPCDFNDYSNTLIDNLRYKEFKKTLECEIECLKKKSFIKNRNV